MSTMEIPGPFTVTDLEGLPDDGHRYELIDGTLIVTPSPVVRHQVVHSEVMRALLNSCPAEFRVLSAPMDVVLADDTVVEPDLLVIPREQAVGPNLQIPPLLAIEILSPSTRRLDLVLKRERYERGGIPAYWIVDPDELSLVAYELRDGAYVEVANVEGEDSWTAAAPFDVTLVPARLAE